MVYNAKESIEKVKLELFQVASSTDRPQGRQLEVIGYPVPLNFYGSATLSRVISFDCKETEQVGKLPPKEKDKGYDGLLIGTTCGAWAGNSGEPVFALPESNEGVKTLVGVLTHTFYVNEDGD